MADEAIIGVSFLEFEIEMSHLSEIDIFVDFETAPGTATPNVDYLPVSGRLRIRAGSQSGFIRVPIFSDNEREDNETFSLRLFNSSEGQIDSPTGDVTVVGTIQNVEAKTVFMPIVGR